MATYKTFTVTVVLDSNDGNNYYHIGGTKTPTLQIIREYEYIFDQSDSSNNTHQMYFSATKNGLHNTSNNYVVGKRYSNGVEYWLDGIRVQPSVYRDNTTFAAATTRQIKVIVPPDCPVTLYPVCNNHSGMYGDSYLTCDETKFTQQSLIDRIDAQADTATVFEVSNLAKALNNVESTFSDTNQYVNSPADERGDAGPEVAYNDRSAEFVIWSGRGNNYGHCGGGSQVYDSMLETHQIRKYMGYHCHDGADGNYHAHNWCDNQSHYAGGCHCYLDTTCHVSSNHCWNNGTDAMGELGHQILRVYEGGEAGYYYSTEKIFRQQETVSVDTWEVRDNRYYVATNGEQINLKDRFMSGMQGNVTPVSSKVYPSGGYGQSSSYNRKRKEAIIVQRSSLNRNPRYGTDTGHTDSDIYFHGEHNTGGSELGSAGSSKYRVRIYYNVPQIDGNTNLNNALNDNDARTMFFNWTFGGHWNGNYKSMLTDDGSIFAVHSGYGLGYNICKLIRSKDDRSLRYNHYGTQFCNGCYTTPNDTNMRGCGVRVVMSRNKRNAILYGSYYYYGSGTCGWIISRDSNEAQGDLIFNTDTTYGTQFVPFRDGDFYAHRTHDWNARSNYECGANCIIHQDGKGNFRRISVGMGMDAQGHTTNYPTVVPIHHDGPTY